MWDHNYAPHEGPSRAQGSTTPLPEYDIVNVPDKDQTPHVTVDPEYYAVNVPDKADQSEYEIMNVADKDNVTEDTEYETVGM